MEVPTNVSCETVALVQKVWEALPDGAGGMFRATETASLDWDSHPLTVCVA
jgi:hypothetical protein